MKKTKLFLFAVICSLITASVTSNVFAVTYIPNPYGYKYATVDVDTSTYLTGFYFSYTQSAVNSWNACGLTSRSISTGTSSPNKIYQTPMPENWFGLYESLVYDTSNAQNRTYFTSKFRITLNTAELSSEDGFVKQGAACHELGHALGLEHNDDATDPSRTIMRTAAYNTVNTPQTYDKNAVNYLWPNW